MTLAKVEAVNSLLLAGEPGNISTDEHSGYTGYKPQAIIDAMNAEFWGAWGFEELSSEIVATGDKGGQLAVAQVKVWLKDVPSQPVGWGQNRVTRGDIGDARKGAQTDAIKKALSYFSIGNRAYQGLLKTDGQPKDAGKNGARPVQLSKHAVNAAPAGNGNKPATPPQKPLHNGDGSPAFPEQHSLEEVKAFFLKYFKPERWTGFKQMVIGMPVEDDGVSDTECSQLWAKLVSIDEDAKRRKAEAEQEPAKASSGK